MSNNVKQDKNLRLLSHMLDFQTDTLSLLLDFCYKKILDLSFCHCILDFILIIHCPP